MKRGISLFFLIWSIFLVWSVKAQQIINGYAEVTAINGTALTIGDVDVNHDQFEVGDQVILMQMQGNVSIDESNSEDFGDIQGIGSAGMYEVLTIESLVSGGTQTVRDVIWLEDFEDLENGDTEDEGETAWERGCVNGGNGCYTGNNNRTLQVRANQIIDGDLSFSGRRLGQEAFWRSEEITIAGYTDVSISIDLAEVGLDNGGADYMEVYYILDGNEVFLDEGIGNFNQLTVQETGLSGNTLQIEVRMMCNGNGQGNNEYPIIDNIEVQGDRQVINYASITLSSNWVHAYQTGPNSSLQLITFPQFEDYATTSDLTALEWNGTIGGVFAVDVGNTLTLSNSIDLTGSGFRGGTQNGTQDGTACTNANQVYRTNNVGFALKGEGVYKNTNNNYNAALAHIANGAGGASYHNAGGGGGGNFTEGGDGGPGWSQYEPNNACNPSGGGFGGQDLSDYISASCLFMGGGGGGGQQNNSLSGEAGDGGDGGGLILIRASTIRTLGGCDDLFIRSDGESKGNSNSDGGGGGGAGGSILFQVDNWELACEIQVSASGGDGSDIVNTDTHGGGGGGGRGVVVFSGDVPDDVDVTNEQGEGGSNSTGPGSTDADSGSDTPDNDDLDPDGVIDSEPGVLPVTLTYWRAIPEGHQIRLTWSTASELNNDYFTIERSSDGKVWHHLADIAGHGTANYVNKYEYVDRGFRSGMVYYRLSQTDFDNHSVTYDVLAVQTVAHSAQSILFPNPSGGVFKLQLADPDKVPEIRLFDSLGKEVKVTYEKEDDFLVFDLQNKAKGSLFLQIGTGSDKRIIRLVIR